MFSKQQFQTLFAYHWFTSFRMLELATKLDEPDLRDSPGYGHGSIHDLLFHLLRTSSSWRKALESGQQTSAANPEDFPDLESIRTGFESERQAWKTLLEGLEAEQIEADIQLTNWKGNTYVIPMWRVLQHLAFHGMQHHSELAQLLTAKGQPPGDIDFIFYRGKGA